MKIIFATKNINKLREVKEILSSSDIDIISMEEHKINIEIIEDGKTFEENAIKKAKQVIKMSNHTVMADDSGLEIDFIDKKPGVLSARFLGENTPYKMKNEIILKMLEGVEYKKRTARFICVIAAVFLDGSIITTKGVLEGFIANKPEGQNGFGYNDIFFVPEFNTTLANVSLKDKNRISHRGTALREMRKFLIKRGGQYVDTCYL